MSTRDLPWLVWPTHARAGMVAFLASLGVGVWGGMTGNEIAIGLSVVPAVLGLLAWAVETRRTRHARSAMRRIIAEGPLLHWRYPPRLWALHLRNEMKPLWFLTIRMLLLLLGIAAMIWLVDRFIEPVDLFSGPAPAYVPLMAAVVGLLGLGLLIDLWRLWLRGLVRRRGNQALIGAEGMYFAGEYVVLPGNFWSRLHDLRIDPDEGAGPLLTFEMDELVIAGRMVYRGSRLLRLPIQPEHMEGAKALLAAAGRAG